MTTEKYNIDKLFKEKFGEASQAPPSYMWHRLGDSLNTVAGSKRRGIYWLSAASFALLIAFGSGYFMAINRVENAQSTKYQSDQAPVIITEKANIANNKTIQPKSIKSPENVQVKQIKQPVLSEKIVPKTQKIIEPTFSVEKINNKVKNPDADLTIQNKQTPEIFIKAKENNPIEIQKDIIDSFVIAEIKSPEIGQAIPNIKKQSWSIGGSASPLFAYRNLKSGESNVYELANNVQRSKTLESDKGYYDYIEAPLFAFAGGLDIRYEIGNRLSVQSGLYYSRQGQVTDEILIYEEFNSLSASSYKVINSSAGDIVSDNRQKSYDVISNQVGVLLDENDYSSIIYSESNLVIHLDYLELPILINYKLIDKKVDALLTAGMVSGFLTSNKAMIKNGNDKSLIGSTQDIRKLNFSSQIGISAEFNILPKLTMSVSPQFRYSLRTINESYYIENYPFSFSVLTGLKVKI